MSNFPQKLKAYEETGNMGYLKEENKVGEAIPEDAQALDLLNRLQTTVSNVRVKENIGQELRKIIK